MRILLTITLLGLTSIAQASDTPMGIDPNVSFSGTRQIETSQGVREVFIRQAPEMVRMEVTQGSRKMIHIVRFDLNKTFMLIPRMNAYQQAPANQMAIDTTDLSFADAKAVGLGEVDGTPCTRYQGQVSDSTGHTAQGSYCVSADGVLLEVDMVYDDSIKQGQKLKYTMRDVEIGEQDYSYFNVPSHYRDLSSGMAGQ